MESASKQFRKRNAILSCLRQTKQHPSAEALYRMLQQEHPDISMATVYRNLALFKRQGLIASLGTVNGVERFDAVTQPHVHFVCQCCDQVVDLPRVGVPQSLCDSVSQGLDCQVDGIQLMFTGVCHGCLSKNSSTKISGSTG